MVVNHCTITRNTAQGYIGGGILNLLGNIQLNASIVAENDAGNGHDISTRDDPLSTVITGSHSYVSDLDGWDPSTAEVPLTLTDGNINLAPLGHYGGPTLTMPPLPGSPAIDPATSISAASDQRGFPIIGNPDIGAVEFQGETISAEPLLSFFFDTDGDGTPNGVEQAIGSDPEISDPNHPNRFRITEIDANGHPSFTFGRTGDIPLTVTRSTNLIDFEFFATVPAGTSILTYTDSNPPADGKAFYRLEALPPSP